MDPNALICDLSERNNLLIERNALLLKILSKATALEIERMLYDSGDISQETIDMLHAGGCDTSRFAFGFP